MSNGKIEMVYAKQALLKPSKNFRYLCQKALTALQLGKEAPAPFLGAGHCPRAAWLMPQ